MKKALVTLLVAALLLTLVPVSAFAEETTASVNTYEDLMAAAANSAVTTINLTGNITVPNTHNTPTIERHLTINGNGFAIDGAEQQRLFVLNKGATINDLTLKNFKSSRVFGGALYVSSDATFTNCTFENNTAALDGGALFIEDGNFAFTNCTFTGNESTDYDGGALFHWGGSLNLNGCTFKNNRAPGFSGDGGAVHSSSSITIVDCTFEGNSAKYKGGALDIGGLGSKYTEISGCTFSNNAAEEGGAAYAWSDLTLKGTNSFVGNEPATEENGIFLPEGKKLIIVPEARTPIEGIVVTADEPEASSISAAVCTGDRVRVRDGAWGKILSHLYKGDTVEVLAIQGDWAQIKFGDSTAFVFAAYLQTSTNTPVPGTVAARRPVLD